MPEGDTIFRTARVLREALEGAEITGASTVVAQVRSLGVRRLVGQTVGSIEPRGKHLLIWFSPSELALHTHMRMNGTWHLYRRDERWRKPTHQARIVLETAGFAAVCFNAPVVALLSKRQVEEHPSLAALGPDALDDEVDLVEARRRLDARGETTIAEALLDQRVLAGVGNVYKSEVLFLHGVDPWSPVAEVAAEVRDELLATSERLLKLNVDPLSGPRRTTTRDPRITTAVGDRLHVYGRARQPCHRCATPIRVARQGEQARLTYWCPRCQGPGPRPRPGR